MNRCITLAALPLLLAGTFAHAVTLGTPFLTVDDTQRIFCIVTNVGTQPTTLSVKLFSLAGAPLAPQVDGCRNAPLAPNASCAVQALPGDVASCVVESSSRRVRAAVEVTSGQGTAVTVIPATGG